MAFIFALIAILFLLGLISLVLKNFIKFLPQIIGFVIVLFCLVTYTKITILLIGGFLALCYCFAFYENKKQTKEIELECLPFFQSKNTTVLTEIFLKYDTEKKKLFLSIYYGQIEKYITDKDAFVDQLFMSDFFEFAAQRTDDKNQSMIFEKDTCDKYLEDVWAQLGKNVDFAKNLLSNSSTFAIQEQRIFQNGKDPVKLIIIKKKEISKNPYFDLSNAISLD